MRVIKWVNEWLQDEKEEFFYGFEIWLSGFDSIGLKGFEMRMSEWLTAGDSRTTGTTNYSRGRILWMHW